MESSKAQDICLVLEQIRQANAKYKAIVLVIDNFSSHRSNEVEQKAKELNIYLVFLPAYSPDLNPIEFIWKSIYPK